MPARRKDADSRRFLDEFERLDVIQLRKAGHIDVSQPRATAPCPDGKTRVIAVHHSRLMHGGSWTKFACPKCGKLARYLYLVDSAPQCRKCCNAMNILYRKEYGFGRAIRRQVSERRLDQRIANAETAIRPRLAQVQRSMIRLRLPQLASQQAKAQAIEGARLKAYQPLAETRQIINLKPIWKARTTETLQRALDNATSIITKALYSDNPSTRIAAARLLLRTRQARSRSLNNT